MLLNRILTVNDKYKSAWCLSDLALKCSHISHKLTEDELKGNVHPSGHVKKCDSRGNTSYYFKNLYVFVDMALVVLLPYVTRDNHPLSST